MYTFQYQLTEDDHFGYRLCHNYTTNAYRKKIILHKYLYPVLLVAWVIFLGFVFSHFHIVYAICGAYSIWRIVSFRKRVERNIRKSLKLESESGKSPFTAQMKMAFGEEKMEITSEVAESLANYSAIERIVTGPNALYLYTSASTAFILPYRIFASEEEKESFLQFIQQKTNAAPIAGKTK